ncbi:hypothetical protein [Streptomyces thermolineatus]
MGPQSHAGPGPSAGRGPGSPSDTLVNGIPAVPPPGPVMGGPDRPAPHAPEEEPSGKGRSKLLLVAAAVLGLVGIAYGTGLLLDHADVPKGTTVLGVDIGGMDRREAVKTLDAALGKRTSAPLTVQIGSEKSELKPEVAGLGIDTEATVDQVARSDYNPVSVIGSLLGRTRVENPVVDVDEEKLRVELETISTRSGGSASADGMVKFTGGKAVAVPGKEHMALDIDDAIGKVGEAYVERSETGKDVPLMLSRTPQPPKVDQAELKRAVDGFGRTAMSGLVTLKTADGTQILFSPKTLGTFLSMRPDANGKLQPVIDLKTFAATYGSTFDGVLLERGTGEKTAVTPQDAAGALLPALRETDPAKRVGIIGAGQ